MAQPRGDISQDWKDVVIRAPPKHAGGAQGSAEQQAARARQQGGTVDVAPRFGGEANPAGRHQPSAMPRKLDDESEQLRHGHVTQELRIVIQQARQRKELSQKELGTMINEKPAVIGEYESGKAIPNQQILGKLERALGVHLRGKNIGLPFAPPAAKGKETGGRGGGRGR